MADSPDLRTAGDMTIVLWVRKTAEASLWSRLVGRGGGASPLNYGFWEEGGAGGRLQFSQYDSASVAVVNCYSTSEIAARQWYHVAAVADGAEARVYIDGVLDGTAARSGTPDTSPAPVTIGYAGYASYFPGILDDIRIYDRALSVEEIQALHQIGFASRPAWYVDLNAPGPVHDGASWETAFLHPQDAMDACVPGEEIRVAQGTYTRRNPASDTVVLTMHQGVGIHGGYAGYLGSDPDERDREAYETILDGEDLAYHVVVGASNATLDGFTVTRGNARSGGPVNSVHGGGMFNENVTGLTVANCTFTANMASNQGGGMWCSTSSPSVSRCAFLSNTANNGAAALNYSSTPTFTSCVFIGNDAGSAGGAMFNWDSAAPTIVNCTFFANTAATSGGAIRNQVDSTGTAANCILWRNTAPTNPEVCLATGSTLDVTYSCIQGGYSGTGNIDADPLFVDAASGDLRLQPGSPCIDAADGDAAPEFDMHGNPRYDDPGVTDTGVGAVTYADMGAYEFSIGE